MHSTYIIQIMFETKWHTNQSNKYHLITFIKFCIDLSILTISLNWWFDFLTKNLQNMWLEQRLWIFCIVIIKKRTEGESNIYNVIENAEYEMCFVYRKFNFRDQIKLIIPDWIMVEWNSTFCQCVCVFIV